VLFGTVTIRTAEPKRLSRGTRSSEGIPLEESPTALRAGKSIQQLIRPGGEIAIAVWDAPERNPWATIPTRALVELGHVEPPDPDAPGMFALADPARLGELVEAAGFVEVVVDAVELTRSETSVDGFLEETLDLNVPFADARDRLSEDRWDEVRNRVASLSEPFAAGHGTLRMPASALVAAGAA